MRIFCAILIILFMFPLIRAFNYDVIVVGGGEAGVAAAIQASLLNVSVALTEETDYIGGMMTAAGVSSMDGNYQGFHRTGIYKNFTDRVIKYYDSIGRSTGICYWSIWVICFEPKVGETILRQMLKEAKVTIYQRIYPVHAYYQSGTNKLQKVVFSGGHVFTAKVFIDASEFGDLLEVAKAKFRIGNRTSENINPHGCVQPFTYTAVMKQYDILPSYLRFRSAPPGFNFMDWNGTVQRNGSTEIGILPWSWDFFKIYRAMPDSTRPGRRRSQRWAPRGPRAR